MMKINGKQLALLCAVLVASAGLAFELTVAAIGAEQPPPAAAGQRGGRSGETGNTKPVPWLSGKVPNLKPVDQQLTDPPLVRAIDLHAHLNPDSSGGGQEPRAIDVID